MVAGAHRIAYRRGGFSPKGQAVFDVDFSPIGSIFLLEINGEHRFVPTVQELRSQGDLKGLVYPEVCRTEFVF